MSLAHASSNQDLSSWDSILNELTGKASAEGITNSQANVQLGAGGSVNGKFWSKFYELLCKKYAQFRKDTRNWPYSFAKNQNSYCFVALKLDRKQPNTRDVTALADFSGFDITGLVSGMSEGQGGANVRTAASGHGITNGSYQGASALTVFGSSQVDAGNGKGDSKLTSKTNVADGDASGNIRMEGSAFGTNSNLNVSNGMNIDDSGRKTRKNVLLHFKLP
ncbi:unnamed protein product [Gongylonema pulchrum]|uniref:FhaB n=1 Tax=Gongylonema pulchrum TaxID=637853 RepID=A0A183DGE1_9BILA|nr:unnamed protein product [Gongylonema pulchrum]